jgi:hypothetical protein
MTPAGPVPWNGEDPLQLTGAARYLTVIAPVVSGWCAIFDTETSVLLALKCQG